MQHCPRCLSTEVKLISHLGIKCIFCKVCGFDEREMYDVHSEERTSQKGKRTFTPYKSGGSGRTNVKN